jgi:hypothetical protein
MTAKKYNQDEYRAYNEAFDCFEAFMNGAPREANPWKLGTARHAAWQDGWIEAQTAERERIAVATRDANTVGYY